MQPRRRRSLIWLVPAACVAAALWLVFSSVAQRGIPIEITFTQGHGLKPQDTVRYRGIIVGKIERVALAKDLRSIAVHATLAPDARDLARVGSRFWVVRPRVAFSGASGLETVVGAKYLTVAPGTGEPRRKFVGLEDASLAVTEPGGMEIVLTTPGQGSLRAGASLQYRHVVIGEILAVDLARDASAVEARAYVKPAYRPLVRANARFWKTGGARVSAGLTGFSVDFDSLQSLVMGGVTLAIPPAPGPPVGAGHRFRLYDEPDQDWLRWKPSLPLFDNAAGQALEMPRLARATLRWRYKNMVYLTRDGERGGWVLPVAEGLLGPADLLDAPAEALADSAELQLGDARAPLAKAAQRYAEGLAVRPWEHQMRAWPAARRRFATTPENSRVVGDPAAAPRFVAAARFRAGDEDWSLDPTLSFDAAWHGAAVVSERDGALIGVLLVTEDRVRVARLAPPDAGGQG